MYSSLKGLILPILLIYWHKNHVISLILPLHKNLVVKMYQNVIYGNQSATRPRCIPSPDVKWHQVNMNVTKVK